MNDDDQIPECDDDLLVRPFLGGPVPAGPPPCPLPPGPAEDHVRPYLMTGGRAAPGHTTVAMETIVVVSRARPRPDYAGLAFERARVMALCEQPISVAEVAAHLRLPLGVARILVADLVAEDMLDASAVAPTLAHDVQFIERLIAGVAAL